MNIDSIVNGIVIDHITAGKALEIYNMLSMDRLECQVAIIQNAHSNKMGKKDIIKIDGEFKIDIDAIGYVDPGATIVFIKNGELVDKKKLDLPKKITNVILCKNPRCITSTEQELPHVFNLTDEKHRIYRCLYCEAKAERK